MGSLIRMPQEKTKPEWNYEKIQVRLSGKNSTLEQKRYEEICRRVRRRSDTARQSDVNRILLGLDPPTRWLTSDEIEYFRGNKDSLIVRRTGSAAQPKDAQAEKDRKVNGS